MRKLAILPVAAALLCACVSGGPKSEGSTSASASPAPAPVTPSAPPAPEARATPPQPAVGKPAVAAPVRIDNTTLATFRTTWRQLDASLSAAERARLNDAAKLIAFSPYAGATQLPLSLRNSPIVPEMIRDQLHGLTYPQIVERSKQLADRPVPTPP
jgi:hypothetical protein